VIGPCACEIPLSRDRPLAYGRIRTFMQAAGGVNECPLFGEKPMSAIGAPPPKPSANPPGAKPRVMVNAAISIVIPTQRRPGPLAVAAGSALRQIGLDAKVELVVVDNDAVPSAQAQVEALAKDAPFPVIYVHEPNSGVANARNAALARASGELIAFLDDDEEASPHWLAALLEVQRAFDADVVFGPGQGARWPGPAPRLSGAFLLPAGAGQARPDRRSLWLWRQPCPARGAAPSNPPVLNDAQQDRRRG